MSDYHKAAIYASRIECEPPSRWELQSCRTAEEHDVFKRYKGVFMDLIPNSRFSEMDNQETAEMLSAHVVDIIREGNKK